MLTETQAYALLHRYGMTGERIDHSTGVARFAHDLASRIAAKHPDLGIDPAAVKVGAILHDIGRCRKGDHEINSVQILREEGHPELAAIVMHGSMYEKWLLRGNEPDPAYLPHTLENKIVAYADARYRRKPVSLAERFEDVKQRYHGDREKVRSVDLAAGRYFQIERELNSLT